MEQRLDATYLRPGLIERAASIGIITVSIGIGVLLATWGISFLWRYAPPEVAVRIKAEQFPPSVTTGAETDPKTATGDVIRREVTVFSNVKHGAGNVVTGWNYKDDGGRVPVGQYCYYAAPNIDQSSTRVDIASNGVRIPHISSSLIPDLEGALAKCQWWEG